MEKGHPGQAFSEFHLVREDSHPHSQRNAYGNRADGYQQIVHERLFEYTILQQVEIILKSDERRN
jgi:hypothetical protein